MGQIASLGLKVQFTEVDVSVYSKEHKRRQRRDTDKSEFTTGMNYKQGAQYKMVFDIFRKHRDKITGVTFWSLTDRYSWLDNFSVHDRKDYPLLFDQNGQPKKAYESVVKF